MEVSLTNGSAFQPSCIATASIDPFGQGVALLTGGSPVLHWLDLVAGKISEARLPTSGFQEQQNSPMFTAEPQFAHIALSGRGDSIVWLNSRPGENGMAYSFSGGASLTPLCAHPATTVVTAVARPFGENFASGFVAPPLIGLAQPGKRRPLFELSMLGSSKFETSMFGGASEKDAQ